MTRRRSPREGSVYELTDGSWRGAVAWTDPDGKRHRRYVRGRTSADARANVDKLRERLRLGVLEPAGAGTVGEYLTSWIERYRSRVRPSTWRGFESHLRVYWIPSLGKVRMTRLTSADVEKALASFQKNGRPPVARRRGRQQPQPISPQTAFHIRATLRRALADAVRAGMVGRNAAADAAPPRVPGREVEYLDRDEVRRLLEATRDQPYGPLYATAVSTGLRLGELLGLAWADIDIAGGTLRVRNALVIDWDGRRKLDEPKTQRSRRTLPLPGTARDALDRQMARQAADKLTAGSAWQDRHGLVFTDALGRSPRDTDILDQLHSALAGAGIRRVRFHDLRHSAATLMLAEGISLKVISEWLGHSGIAITDKHYAAVTQELAKQAAAAMDRALAGGVS